MRKLLITLVVGLLAASCATTSKAKKYPRLTSENVQNTCEPTETWSLRVMPMPIVVLRFGAGCGGIKDLLLVVTPADTFTTEQRELTVRLALTYYVDYANREHPAEDGKKWRANSLKREVDSSDADGPRELFYYEVTKQ